MLWEDTFERHTNYSTPPPPRQSYVYDSGSMGDKNKHHGDDDDQHDFKREILTNS